MDKKEFMLCEKIKEEELNLLNGEYSAQIKYDGERCISIIQDNQVFMINRRGKLINFHFQEIEDELKRLDNCILDGEICVLDKNGKSDFTLLQSRALTQNRFKQEQLKCSHSAVYFVFDVLKIESQDLRDKPLKERIRELFNFFDRNDFTSKYLKFIKLAEWKPINELLFEAKLRQEEGIIIKDLNSKYENRRSKSWLKLKFFQEIEVYVTKLIKNPAGIRVSDDTEKYICQIAGKQSQEVEKEIIEKGKALISIQYLTKTEKGFLRFPSFRELIK